jgi:DNA segregation ATPase FtsK/SpoIIIE, S-DNA-T family
VLAAAVFVGMQLAKRRSFASRATRALIELGLANPGRQPRVARARRSGKTWDVAWRMPPGISVSALLRRRGEIEEALDVSAEFWYERGLVNMRAATGQLPDRVTFSDFYSRPRPKLVGRLPIGIGMTRHGPLWSDLADLPHLLVGGQTNSGKSAFIRQLLTWAVLTHSPEDLRLGLIDLKGGLEFNVFERLPHMLGPVARDLDGCLALMEVLLAELDQRQAALDRLGAESIRRWNAVGSGRHLPYVLVVVDEMAELSAVESSTRDEKGRRQAALASVSRMCRLGRATGFHVVVSTQRPDAEAVPGQIKANIPATVAFRVRSAINSRILLGEDNTGAASLPPMPGRGIWQFDNEVRFQSIWLDKPAAETAIAPLVGQMAGTERVTPCLPLLPRKQL